jgi:hypothetical protein
MLGAVDDHARLQAVLRPDEQLLWLGRPDPRLWFTGADVFLVPFSVLWCAFATLFEVAESRGGAFFAALGVPFIAAGLYLVVGRFFYKHYRKKRTVYGVTTQRALVAVGARPVLFADWPGRPMTIRRSRDGTHASVTVEATGLTALALAAEGWAGKRSYVHANTGLSFGTDLQVAFYDVADAAAMLAALDQARGRNDLAS